MNAVDIPLKNEIAMQKDIFRFSATLFSETNDAYSTADAQLQMVKCMFVKYDNAQMSKADIVAGLLDVYRYHVSEGEITNLIDRSRKVFQSVTVDGSLLYNLTPEAYSNTLSLQKKSIDAYIDIFSEQYKLLDPILCKDAIYRYLYELTTTNINAYRVLLSGNKGCHFTDAELSVDVTDLGEKELECIHAFLDWDHKGKNATLVNVVFTCLEYCLLISGDSPNSLLKGVYKQRIVYLDTNVIFRALGINGESRKKVVLAFLHKCKQANIKLVILSNTKKEFFETTDTYISHIDNFPRGTMYPGAYEAFSDYNMYAFYDEWHQAHPMMSLKYFQIHIETLYNDFIKKNGIIDDEKIPMSINTAHTFGQLRNTYSRSIYQKKQNYRLEHGLTQEVNHSSTHDGTIIRYIEMLREQHVEDREIYLVSSDKILRAWDMNRENSEYPVVIYPSQLFLVLLKMCGRSDDDYKSFIQFINIKPKANQMTSDKANVIISAISSITEDVKAQRGIVDAFCDGEIRKMLQQSQSDSDLYESVQNASKHYLETELAHSELRADSANKTVDRQKQMIIDLRDKLAERDTQAQDRDADVDRERQGYQDTIHKLTNEGEQHREKVCRYAEKRIRFPFIMRWYVLPSILATYVLACVVFISLQLVFCNAEWNIVTKFFKYVSTTTFGKNIGEYVATINAAVLAPIIPLYKWGYRNPFDKLEKDKDKQSRISKYIESNVLG